MALIGLLLLADVVVAIQISRRRRDYWTFAVVCSAATAFPLFALLRGALSIPDLVPIWLTEVVEILLIAIPIFQFAWSLGWLLAIELVAFVLPVLSCAKTYASFSYQERVKLYLAIQCGMVISYATIGVLGVAFLDSLLPNWPAP